MADTTTPHSKLMLTVLRALAEFERTLIRARTQRVVSAKRALAVGIRFSRKPKLTPISVKKPKSGLKRANPE